MRLIWAIPFYLLVALVSTSIPVYAATAQDRGMGRDGDPSPPSAQAQGDSLASRRVDSVRITLRLSNVTLEGAVRAVAQQAKLRLVYDGSVLPTGRRVSVELVAVGVQDAFRAVLGDTDVDVVIRGEGQAVLVRRPRPRPAPEPLASITGHVTEASLGTPVENAVVQLSARLTATTDADGAYRISGIPAGTFVMVVRRLGYREATRTVTVTDDEARVIDVSLVRVPLTLSQVVTTATGERRRVEVGNVIEGIRADSLARTAPVMSLSQVLAARVPGVQVYFTGGISGTAPQVNIRGQNSLSMSNQPLLYVDGVRVENSTAKGRTPPTVAGQSAGRFDDINPADIESIEIVKGPSAATLYGTDAANGVILVKTKRGGSGEPQWTVFGETGALTFDRDRFPTSYFPWGHRVTGAAGAIRCTLLSVAAGTCAQDSVTTFSPLRDAETTPIGSGSRRSIGAQVSSGATTRYFLSGTAEQETGYLKMPRADERLLATQLGHGIPDEAAHPNAVSKVGFRSNVFTPLGSTANLAVSASLGRSEMRLPDPLVLLFGAASTGVRDQNDGWTLGFRPGDNFIKRSREEATHLTGGVVGDWQPRSNVTGHATLGIDFSSDYLDRLARAGLGFPLNAGSRENTKTDAWLQTASVTGSVELPITARLVARTSVGGQYNRRDVQASTTAARNLVPGAETVAGGSTPTVGESTIESVVAGTYVEQSLALNDRLFIVGALRADGASSFGEGFKTALYPKASVSWLLSGEPFWPTIPGVSSVRLRGAYGQSGVQPGAVAAVATETLFPGVVGGQAATGAHLGAVGNRDLKPERQREIEAGLDADVASQRVTLGLTYYDKRSNDALVSVPLPTSFGGGARWENVGAVRNKGYEAQLSARLLQRPSAAWSVLLSGSVNDNTILEIAPGIDTIFTAATVAFVRGHPLYSYFQYPITGVTDRNGNGIVEASEVVVGTSRTFAGRGFPRTQLSGTTTLSLLGDRIQFAATAEHRGGFSILNSTEGARCAFDSCVALARPNTPLDRQAAAVAIKTSTLRNTSWGFFEDASFTRLRELSITYALPARLVRQLRAHEATLGLAGRNLLRWSSYSGVDPEVQGDPGRADVGASFDGPGLPAPTYWIVRLRIGL